jgi:hypothetical protein
VLGRSRQRGKLVLSAQSLCPDILGMLNLSQPFGLGADPLAVDLRPHFSLVGFGINYWLHQATTSNVMSMGTPLSATAHTV